MVRRGRLAVQADFGIERGAAAIPFTLTMIGFGLGDVIMGKLADRRGIVLPLLIVTASLGTGFILASFPAAYALIGTCGTAATFSALFGLFQGGLVPSYAIIVCENSPANQAGDRVASS